MTNTQWLRDRLYTQAGIDPRPLGHRTQSLEQVFRGQWSAEFERYMRNRLAMGYFRYTPLSEQDGTYDNVGSCRKRLALYDQTHNMEHLVDVANICLVEFVTGTHPDRHFEATDDGIHTEKKQ